ncbi:hypothetical protein CYMTET_14125 [Cymbomonas tetramitiformis]|uniref:Calpain catalytic domain-containing protein n=1 Tax=Cymbomonas tetramitiformis TaxID=36881 RepID=A0AAE0GGN0_9CHLO|nr:hypothetical protein CYMTET_14125 [Cymbomonas tetramitiformis]
MGGLIELSKLAAQKAIEADEAGDLEEAEKWYMEAADSLLRLVANGVPVVEGFSSKEQSRISAAEYIARAEHLRALRTQPGSSAARSDKRAAATPCEASTSSCDVENQKTAAAELRVQAARDAMSLEARGDIDTAVHVYEGAIAGQLCVMQALGPSGQSMGPAVSLLLDELERLKLQQPKSGLEPPGSAPGLLPTSTPAPAPVPPRSSELEHTLRGDVGPNSGGSLPIVLPPWKTQPASAHSLGSTSSDTGIDADACASASTPPIIRGPPSRSTTPASTVPGKLVAPSAPRGGDGRSATTSPALPTAFLTPQEKQVLQRSSYVAGQVYLPWLPQDDVDQLSQPSLFSDSLLVLSPSQIKHLAGWKRLPELAVKPVLVHSINAFTVRQTLVPNCSFVSSLCCCALYEARFNRRLLTSRLFPQDAHGEPKINPSGQYAVKLHFNGVERKVLVDDRLPCDAAGRLICAHSSHSSEFWVSIIEKAFLKVHGGYNFRGSSSELDMYMLTGWIPEGVPVHEQQRVMGTSAPTTLSRKLAGSFDAEKYWTRLRDGHYLGQCLISASTTALTEQEEKVLGLVERHAYAVLDVREVCGHRLLLLKNPWSSVRWNGPFSPGDTKRWTPELRRALNYDTAKAQWIDNGVFWIDWRSLLTYFAKLHFNWNPFLFKLPEIAHFDWPFNASEARKDIFSLAHTPQFAFTCDNRAKAAGAGAAACMSVWVHLTKHVLQPQEENEDFIALHVFERPAASAGKQVFYMEEATRHGVYINSPHLFLRLDVPPGAQQNFVLVVSQQDRTSAGSFTLRVYCTAKIELRRIPNLYRYEIGPFAAKWPVQGGRLNPLRFNLTVDQTTEVCIRLEAPKNSGALLQLEARAAADHNGATMLFRPGFCFLRENIGPGAHSVLAFNYEGIGGLPAILRIGSSNCTVSINLSPLPATSIS